MDSVNGIVQWTSWSQTGQYKVVRIFRVLDKNTSWILESNCDVYTLGEENQGLGLWRRIGHAPFVFIRSEYGIFLNGNLHWLIKDQDGDCQSISCFDLEPFPAPPELKDFHLASLGVLGGCLSLCYNASDCEIVIWVMQKNGNTKTWSKEIVINKGPDSLVGTIREDVRVLEVFKDGDVLLLWGYDLLLYYDSRRKILHLSSAHDFDDQMNEEGCVDKSYASIEAIEYVSSLLSLENFGI